MLNQYTDNEPYKKTKLLIIFILYLSACIETDLLLPSLPSIMTYFSINGSYVQKVFSLNFVAIGISSFLLGTISDFLGRKSIILFSLLIFLAGSIITLIVKDFNFFLVGRFIQGLGVGGIFSLGMAIIGDFFPGKRAIVARSCINSVMPLLISLMPIVGKTVNQYYGFRGICYVITATALISLCLKLFFFQKINFPKIYKNLKFKEVISNYKFIASSSEFWLLNLKISLLSAGYLAFNAQIAILFMVDWKMQGSVFCYFQISIILSYIIGNLLSAFIIKKFAINVVKIIGLILVLTGAICLLSVALFYPVPILIVGSMVIYVIGYVVLQMIFFSELLQISPEKRGTIASLRTSSRLLLTTLILEILANSYNGSIMPTAIIECIISLLVCAMMLYKNKIHTGNLLICPSQN